jgi:hypothetical protein
MRIFPDWDFSFVASILQFFTLDDLLFRPESYNMLQIERVDIVFRAAQQVQLNEQSAVRLMRLRSCQRLHPNHNISALEFHKRSFDEPKEQNQLLSSVQFIIFLKK